jgi:hypothetical protein
MRNLIVAKEQCFYQNAYKKRGNTIMHINDQNREQLQPISSAEQVVLVIGFVIFITGLFSIGYALLASFLLPASNSTLLVAAFGLLGTYLGRKVLRRGRKEITL